MAADEREEHRPRSWSPRTFRWIMNLYPPFFFGGIRLVEVADDFSSARIRVRRGILNRNLNGTVFGGSLYSAADPIYAVLFWQLFAREGVGLRVWTKAAEVEFLAPVRASVELVFDLDDALLRRARAALESDGRFEEPLRVDARAPDGEVCFTAVTVVHLSRR